MDEDESSRSAGLRVSVNDQWSSTSNGREGFRIKVEGWMLFIGAEGRMSRP